MVETRGKLLLPLQTLFPYQKLTHVGSACRRHFLETRWGTGIIEKDFAFFLSYLVEFSCCKLCTLSSRIKIGKAFKRFVLITNVASSRGLF
jgi:hypothetical protein